MDIVMVHILMAVVNMKILDFVNLLEFVVMVTKPHLASVVLKIATHAKKLFVQLLTTNVMRLVNVLLVFVLTS
jgi:hypothetical protein